MLGVFILTLSPAMAQIPTNQSVPEYIESVSVRIDTPRGHGSGVVFKRKDSTGSNDVYFVWSVGHLFHHRAETFELFSLKISKTNTVTHEASMTQTISVGGEEQQAGTNVLIHLIKLSDPENNDIALLQLEKPFYNTNTAVFDLSGRIPHVGEHLYNVGSPDGFDASLSEGVFSFVGRRIKGDSYMYDQTTCVIFPGSSGGGYFNTKGECVGVAEGFMDSNMNVMVPIRRLHEWAKHEHLEWALDPTLPMPTAEEINKIKPVSDL
jgi:S1-C subfamily serine protease